MKEHQRQPAVAGQFYSARKDILEQEVMEALAPPEKHLPGTVRAVIVPHAGHQFSGPTAGKAFALLQGNAAIKKVAVLAPSHRVGFKGVSVGNYDSFVTPLGKIEVDSEICQDLVQKSPLISDRTDCHEAEHALEVELPFIQKALPEAELVPVVCGQMSENEVVEVGAILAEVLWRDDVLWVVSSDFTHYGRSFGYMPFVADVPERLRELDLGAVEAIESLELKRFLDYISETGATVCGRTPIALLLGAVEKQKDGLHVHLLEYTTSGKLTGDFQHSVSYASLAVCDESGGPRGESGEKVANLEPETKELLLKLARDAIEANSAKNTVEMPGEDALPEVVREQYACFVTLHKGRQLRGCIGSLTATEPLYKNVAHNARNAAFHDPRFPPVALQEMDEISIEISVLTPAVPIGDPDEFEVGRHGIILERGPYRAVFLPQVAPEQGWDRETTLNHLALKAGLAQNGWRRGASFKVFEAIVFGEAN